MAGSRVVKTNTILGGFLTPEGTIDLLEKCLKPLISRVSPTSNLPLSSLQFGPGASRKSKSPLQISSDIRTPWNGSKWDVKVSVLPQQDMDQTVDQDFFLFYTFHKCPQVCFFSAHKCSNTCAVKNPTPILGGRKKAKKTLAHLWKKIMIYPSHIFLFPSICLSMKIKHSVFTYENCTQG